MALRLYLNVTSFKAVKIDFFNYNCSDPTFRGREELYPQLVFVFSHIWPYRRVLSDITRKLSSVELRIKTFFFQLLYISRSYQDFKFLTLILVHN